MQNAHSFRVAKILTNFSGIKLMMWNLTNWSIGETSVSFTICKDNFFGIIRVMEIEDDAKNFMVLSKQMSSDEVPIVKCVSAITLPLYIESLTVAKAEAAPQYPLERAEGHRVPNLESIPQAA